VGGRAALCRGVRAGLFDRATGSTAVGAGLCAHELAERAPRDSLEAPGAAARPTGDRAGAGRGATANAGATRYGDGERDLTLGPCRRLDELDLDADTEVGAACARRPGADAEEVIAEERGEEIGEAAEVELRRRAAAAAERGMAEPVVELAGLSLREHLVGLDDLPEALLRVGRCRDIGMELTRKPPEGALDLGLVRGTRDAEHLVVVALCRRHQASLALPLAVTSIALVDFLDEARELGGRTAHRPERLLVVHPDRTEQADGSECAVGETVGRADQR